VTQGANSDLTRCSRMHRYSITHRRPRTAIWAVEAQCLGG